MLATKSQSERVAELRSSAARTFTRHVMALGVTGGDVAAAAAHFAERWPEDKGLHAIQRAAVEPGKIDGWGAEISPLQPFGSAFLGLVRPRTALGRMAGLRRVPFRTKVPRQVAAAGVTWTAEGAPIMASELVLDQVTLEASRVAGLMVISAELARSSDPAAEALVENDLAASVAAFTDTQMLDPTVAEVSGVSPASITYGAPMVAASGVTKAAFADDARSLVGLMIEQGAELVSPYWVMSPKDAISLNLLGYETVGIDGGTLAGIPVLTTTGAPAEIDTDSPPTDLGGRLYLVDADQVMLADGGFEVAASKQGTVQLSTDPDDPADATTVQVSLWQHGLVGVKAQRFIRWQARSAGVAGYIDGARYGAAS